MLTMHGNRPPGHEAITDQRGIRRHGGGLAVANRAARIALAAATLVVAFSAAAPAKKDADLTARVQCVTGCLTEEGTCQSACCGRIFCRRSCLDACYTNELVCEADCDVRLGGDPDGAFHDTATWLHNGRVIRISGPLQCPPGATVDLNVTLTQNAGPVAKGHVRLACPAGETTFTARAVAVGDARFQPLSTATACGVARVHAGARGVNAFQWCRDVTLVPQGIELED